jgi:hypothetical protein
VVMAELRSGDVEMYEGFTRMSPEPFDELLDIVRADITKSCRWRMPISADIRLAVTLRFLATGAIVVVSVFRLVPPDSLPRAAIVDDFVVFIQYKHSVALHIYRSVHIASQHLVYSAPVQAKRTSGLYVWSLIGRNTAILAGIFDMLNMPASRCNNLQLLAVVVFFILLQHIRTTAIK